MNKGACWKSSTSPRRSTAASWKGRPRGRSLGSVRMRREAGDTPNVAATQQHRNTTRMFCILRFMVPVNLPAGHTPPYARAERPFWRWLVPPVTTLPRGRRTGATCPTWPGAPSPPRTDCRAPFSAARAAPGPTNGCSEPARARDSPSWAQSDEEGPSDFGCPQAALAERRPPRGAGRARPGRARGPSASAAG